MTNIDLDALEATARAARTPGPWETRCEGYGEPTRVCHDSEYVIYLGYDYAADFGASDAEHIAAFDPTTALALIARLREAEAVIAQALDATDNLNSPVPEPMVGVRRILMRYKAAEARS